MNEENRMDTLTFVALGVGAALVGFSKTAISGAATVSVVIFATVLPTRESTGVLLVLLMVGDALAVWTYRREADWGLIRRLLVPVVAGIVVGAFFLGLAPIGLLKPVIGGIVVVMTLIQAVRMVGEARGRRRVRAGSERAEHGGHDNAAEHSGHERAEPGAGGVAVSRSRHPGSAGVFGSLAGFTTMVANAGGPVMTLYLLRSRLQVRQFVGTMAWFFACVNVVKLPFSVGMGLVSPQRFLLCLSLVPAVVLGAVIGRLLIARISRPLFEKIVLLVAGLSGTYLMLS